MRASLVRQEPFRIFFPLALVLGLAGVAHWTLFGAGAIDSYLGVFHVVTQAQAFMVAFAAGFLLTAVPRRTRSAPASLLEIAALVALLCAVAGAAALGRIVTAQIAYALALALLVQFALRRFVGGGAGRRPPASFALVPIGIAAGLAGAGMLIARELGGPAWMLALGRALVSQGVFVCLALGVGGLVLPLVLRGEGPPDASPSRRDRIEVAVHLVAGVALVASIVLEGAWARAGLVRAGIAVALLLRAGAHRRATRTGLNRRIVQATAWLIPAGLALAALLPAHKLAALHVLYVGGFGQLAFSVSAHVTLGHGGHEDLQAGRPWPVAAFALLFGVATALRATASAVPDHYIGWLAAAAAVWTAAAVVWAAFLLPKMWRRPAQAR